ESHEKRVENQGAVPYTFPWGSCSKPPGTRTPLPFLRADRGAKPQTFAVKRALDAAKRLTSSGPAGACLELEAFGHSAAPPPVRTERRLHLGRHGGDGRHRPPESGHARDAGIRAVLPPDDG